MRERAEAVLGWAVKRSAGTLIEYTMYPARFDSLKLHTSPRSSSQALLDLERLAEQTGGFESH